MSLCSNCGHTEADHPNSFLCHVDDCLCGGWVKAAAGTREVHEPFGVVVETWVCESKGQKKCSPERQYASHIKCGFLVK